MLDVMSVFYIHRYTIFYKMQSIIFYCSVLVGTFGWKEKAKNDNAVGLSLKAFLLTSSCSRLRIWVDYSILNLQVCSFIWCF